MRSPARFLLFSAEPSSAAIPFDTDVVVILVVLLCAALSFAGLALVARCSSLRSAGAAASAPPPNTPPNKGVKKKALLALPTLAFDSSASAGGGAELVDCAICLAEFADGEIVRVLPQCGHGFHRDCVDVWLRSRASCPSCRQSLTVSAPPVCERCSNCKSSGAVAVEYDGGGSSTFLP